MWVPGWHFGGQKEETTTNETDKEEGTRKRECGDLALGREEGVGSLSHLLILTIWVLQGEGMMDGRRVEEVWINDFIRASSSSSSSSSLVVEERYGLRRITLVASSFSLHYVIR